MMLGVTWGWGGVLMHCDVLRCVTKGTNQGWSLIYCVLYNTSVIRCLEHPPNDDNHVNDRELMMIR